MQSKLHHKNICKNPVSGEPIQMYYVIGGTHDKRYLARSTDYGITWTDTQRVFTDSTYESIIMNPDSTRKYMAYNGWRGPAPKKSYMFTHYSDDGGFNFFNKTQLMELGEDKSFIWNEEENEYWGYVRPYNIEPSCCFTTGCVSFGDGVRKIALMKNSQYFASSGNWSARNIILEVDTNDYINENSPDYRTQMYYMQVFRSGDDWWGLVGMYRVGNNGGENNNWPFTHPEYTSNVELVWSDDGENWCRTNNKQPFIALHDSINTIYTLGTLVGDSVYFYSSESTILHSLYFTQNCNYTTRKQSEYFGKYYSIYLYKIGIDKLNDWRPSSTFKINCAVEGFLNTGSGKLNLRDTLTAELRNSSSPYGIAATAKSVIDSVTFLGNFNFPHVDPGNYYIAIYGRNSLETWSDSAKSVCNGVDAISDFTTGYNKAFGGNLVLKGGKYCIFSGDLNNDDIIDNDDQSTVDNDILNFVAGYVNSDVNGDLVVDIADGGIVGNNVANFVSTIHP
ncbi:MAG: sialidase family protein [Ignavibacteria bacterium]